VQRNAVPTVKPEALSTIYPLELRKAGYRTGLFGKWHFRAPAGFSPAAQFDAFEAIDRNPYFKTLPDGTPRHETDLICDRGIEFIKSQDKDRPFCLNLWFNAAHAEDRDQRPGIGHHPWPQSTNGLYEDIAIPPPRLGDPAIYEGQPQFLKDSINRQRYFWGYDTPERFETNVRAYYRMITGIDYAIARVLDVLQQADLAENTIIVYSGDNGYYLGDRGFQGKWSHFEESLRVPLVVYDPRLPSEQRGRIVDALALNVDLPATFLNWAGVTLPASYEGRSLAPLIENKPYPEWRKYFFCEHVDLAPALTWEGIRGERFVYARYFDQQPAFEFLHDLTSDPDELKNLAADPAHVAELARMRALCDREMNLRSGAFPPLPERNAKQPARGKKKRANQEVSAKPRRTIRERSISRARESRREIDPPGQRSCAAA
jgi:arylsulfatase A-like enzyme